MPLLGTHPCWRLPAPYPSPLPLHLAQCTWALHPAPAPYVMQEKNHWKKFHWRYIIIDEAHRLARLTCWMCSGPACTAPAWSCCLRQRCVLWPVELVLRAGTEELGAGSGTQSWY